MNKLLASLIVSAFSAAAMAGTAAAPAATPAAVTPATPAAVTAAPATPATPAVAAKSESKAEVKARASGGGFVQLERWLAQHDALFLRRDRADPLVLLPWSTWARLISRKGAA